MRGDDAQLQPGMFSYIALEDRIPTSHPLRAVRQLVDVVLAEMSAEFDGLYAEGGRRSISPERLLRALLLQVFYSIRSERELIEQLDYNLLFRWFVGLAMDDPVWNHAVFSKNRDRLLNQEMARSFRLRRLGCGWGLSRREAHQPDACVPHRSGCAGLPEIERPGSPAQLSWAHRYRESPWPDRRSHDHAR